MFAAAAPSFATGIEMFRERKKATIASMKNDVIVPAKVVNFAVKLVDAVSTFCCSCRRLSSSCIIATWDRSSSMTCFPESDLAITLRALSNPAFRRRMIVSLSCFSLS